MNSVRYLNKANNANEIANFSGWWAELIQHYGTSVTYYTHGYTLSTHNFLYGEDPLSQFVSAGDVVMLTDITNDALLLSKFGVMADCDMTAIVHIDAFKKQFGEGAEPKSGDLIHMVEFGSDRPNGRGGPIYEITERDDENLAMTNPLLGHIVWYIKTKRFEYSYEPGVEPEKLNGQINDSGSYGDLESLLSSYPLSSDDVDVAGKEVFDYDCEDNDSPYGNY